MARPTNAERYSPQAQRDKLKMIVGDALTELHKKIKNADANTLAQFVTKMLPLVTNEDTQTTTDATFEMLAKKALKISVRIKDANESQLASEEIEDEEEI